MLPALVLLAATASPAAPELLEKVRRVYTSSPSVTANFIETYAPAGFAAASPETGLVTIQAPDLIRFDYDGSDGKVFTFDGKAGRQYVAADKQLVVRELGAADRARLPILFLESPEKILARYAAAAKPALAGVWELSLAPKEEGLPALDLHVTDSGEVKRLVVKDAAGNTTTFNFTKLAPGHKRSAATFTLDPPKGTKIISE